MLSNIKSTEITFKDEIYLTQFKRLLKWFLIGGIVLSLWWIKIDFIKMKIANLEENFFKVDQEIFTLKS